MPSNKAPGRAAVASNSPLTAEEEYRVFILNAEFYGLPVNFLRVVQSGYTFSYLWELGKYTALDNANTWLNSLTMRHATYDKLVDMDVDSPVSLDDGINTTYHECTHAYLDLKENDPKFAAFIKDGIAYYKNAPMANRGVSSDPDRVFQEAAASYVGNRAETWWSTYKSLAHLASTPRTDQGGREKSKKLALKFQADYEQSLKQRVFGYEDQGFPSQQVATTRPISEKIRAFLDHELLEDKIPDDFNSVPILRQLLHSFG